MEKTKSELIFETIDQFFANNQPKGAEQYMLSELDISKDEGRVDDELLLLNELIGYYRQTSESEKLCDVIRQSINLADQMQLNGTVPYATTMINAANAYRSMGMLEDAKKYYGVAEEIYANKVSARQLKEDDMLLAGLFNNISLMYQEMSDYRKAEQYLKKALQISVANGAKFEIAVTNANLANTYLLAEDYNQTVLYAKKAIALFQEMSLKDPHYCAALSALGNCYIKEGNLKEAKELFMEAIAIVESTIGHNAQYERLVQNMKLCEQENISMNIDNKLSGMELSRLYYEEYGQKMIQEKFPEYENKIAVGLVGEGSDCFGYDDVLSMDHDYGAGFCMWLSDETYAKIGEALQAEYNRLPTEFRGVKRNETVMGQGRRGVFRITDYYEKFLNTRDFEKIDYSKVPDYALAACTNGVVFVDEEGVFSTIRNQLLTGYPANIRLLKLAEDVSVFSQCGQYNYKRMKSRQDGITASLMLHDFCKGVLKLYHHLLNVYPPHDKWLVKRTSLLDGGKEVVSMLDDILTQAYQGDPVEQIEESIEKLGCYFAAKMYENGDISDTDSYLDHHIEELVFKAGIIMKEHDALVDEIAALEFQAFDKVKNEGGRASCQNDWMTFSVMRKSQYLTWDQEMLVQYYYDFARELKNGHNLITEKYGRMMESTANEKYEEIKNYFPELSDEKKQIIEQIVGIQMQMVLEFAKEHPLVAGNARSLHTHEDNMFNTSYETYLRGEISTYSDKMLQLYGRYVARTAMAGENIARMTIENTAKLYGYQDIDEFEKRICE